MRARSYAASVPTTVNPSGLPTIGRTLVSARSFDEYVAMFALTSEDLAGSVLDCPGGAASFTAEARGRGSSVVAVDPIYAAPAAWLAQHAVDEAFRGNRHTASSVDSFVWTFFTDIADHLHRRMAAARLFGHDLAVNPSAYVAGSLPQLPFQDESFDLVLSSHLLFSYADRLDRGFHLRALLELVRVCRGEVRVYPLVHHAGRPLPALVDGLLADLTAAGLRAEVRPTPYEFQRGARELLAVSAPAR
jgi:SAM-dependent methyltransferase